MIDTQKREEKERKKAQTRKRMHVEIDPDNYEYTPAKKPIDYYDTETPQRVAIYVRVSTDDVRQTTSFELQKQYYEEFVSQHSNWTLVKIYADEGISGTSIKHRDGFNEMIADCRAGKANMIITKSVSRFARNVVDCIGLTRDLAELKPPVGVFFESECIFSLNDDSQMALTFVASMAEEESHTRSRSMETSLRMRLDHGIPLTPKLLGYTHDEDGNLVINPEEAPTVKLAFYMYLYGYSTQQIADTFNALGRKSYLGNINWTSSGIVQILRNERHCGDVITRKTFTPNYRDHKSVRNRGERPQSTYHKHHEGIVSRDDFIAVQRMLDNAKYRNKSYLPELRVIESGILKGFVAINPRWAGFKEQDYFEAAQSVYAPTEEKPTATEQQQPTIPFEVGDFDLRGFEITRSEFFDSNQRPTVTFAEKKIKFSTDCIRRFGTNNYVELLVNPVEKKFAVRRTTKENRQAVVCSQLEDKKYQPKTISASAFSDTLFSIFGWNTECKYRIIGSLYEENGEIAYVFDTTNSEIFFKSYVLTSQEASEVGRKTGITPYTPSGKRIRGIPQEWTNSFGKPYYQHEHTLAALATQSETDWQIRMEGQLYETSRKINVTRFDDLKQYINQELSGISPSEVKPNE